MDKSVGYDMAVSLHSGPGGNIFLFWSIISDAYGWY